MDLECLTDNKTKSHIKTYQLLVNEPVLRYRTLSSDIHKSSNNIVNDEVQMFVGEELNERPIGGASLLKKMILANELKLRRSSKGKIKLNESNMGNPLKKKKRFLTEPNEDNDVAINKRN